MPYINKINVGGVLYDVQDLEASTAVPQIKQMISNVESSPATAAHAAGSYLIYNNTLYRASAAIAVGDALTVGTNIAAVSGGLAGDVADLKSALTSTVDEIANYPAKTDVINITSTDFVQGYRHNQSGASIKNDSGYTTTKNVIQFKKGDIFTHPTDQGIMYYFVTTAGAFYKTYVPSPYTVPEDIDLYLDCGKSGITPQTTPTVQYTKKTIIEKIVEKDESLQAQIDKLKTNFPELEECYKQGDASVKQGYKLVDGVVTSTSATWLCCAENFIECKTGDIFLILQCYNIARYTDSDAASYVSTVAVANLPLYSGNERWNVWVADLDGYVRFTLWWSNPVECAVTRLNLSDHPYTCVCLGDSIFGNNQKPNDLPTYMQKVDGLMTANCGFGGTEAATHFNQIYTPLSFWKIADAINSGDWSDIDVDWNAINNDHVFMANVYILCHLVDWSKVRTITVAYGTNDWNAGVSIDNESNSKDVTTYKGALRYGIEKIQSAYPQINIIMLSPLFRYWSNSQDYSTVDDDSDNRVNDGRKLYEYVTAMKEVAEEYHIPFFDNYNTAGINKFTAPAILRDGTHLNYKYGVSMVGKHLGAEVALSNRSIDTEY